MSTLTEPTTAMAGVAVHTTPMLSSTTCIIILWVDGILFLTFSQNQTGFVLTFNPEIKVAQVHPNTEHIRFLVLSRPMHAMSRQRHASDLEQKPLQLFSTGSSHQINEQNTINGVLHFQILYFLRPLLTPFPSWGWKTGLVTVLTRNIAIHDWPVSPQEHHLCNFQQKLWQFIASSIM